jgi:hypothetical protein
MANIVLKVDDFDPDIMAAHTKTFVVDDVAYVIDLGEDNLQRFKEAFGPFVEHATRIGPCRVAVPMDRTGPGPKPTVRLETVEWWTSNRADPPSVAAGKKQYRNMVRQWAQEPSRNAKYKLGDQGRIPKDVFDDFEEWARKNNRAYGPESVGLSL